MRDDVLNIAKAADMMPMQARGLTLSAGGKKLIDGIDLTLEAGHRTVIMGPNGAGKSLLLRLLHGLVTPSAGTMEWAGKPLDASIRKRQALVFQRPVLLRRSAAANIDFAIGLHRAPEPHRRNALLQLVGLLEHARQPARLLSGGEQQRLALARALATNPDVLFLDEPTANLDPASTLLIERIVGEVHEAGCKIVYVTHDIGQARRLADKVVFLNRGRLVEHTRADKFFASPASAAATAYLEGRIDF